MIYTTESSEHIRATDGWENSHLAWKRSPSSRYFHYTHIDRMKYHLTILVVITYNSTSYIRIQALAMPSGEIILNVWNSKLISKSIAPIDMVWLILLVRVNLAQVWTIDTCNCFIEWLSPFDSCCQVIWVDFWYSLAGRAYVTWMIFSSYHTTWWEHMDVEKEKKLISFFVFLQTMELAYYLLLLK